MNAGFKVKWFASENECGTNNGKHDIVFGHVAQHFSPSFTENSAYIYMFHSKITKN